MRIRVRALLVFLLLTVASAPAPATSQSETTPLVVRQPEAPPAPAAPQMSVEELVRLALRDNPELAAMRAEAGAAAARPAQARALPDPRFSYSWMGEHIETARGPQSATYRLSQDFPFFGKRGLLGKMAEREAGAAAEGARAMELALAAETRREAAEIAYLDAVLTIQGEDRRLLHEIREIASTRYATGVSRLDEVARIEVELAENEQEILDLRREREIAAAEMNRLLGRDAGAALPPIEAALHPDSTLLAAALVLAPAPSADSLAAGGEARPELRAAELAIARSDAAARLARRNYFPDLMLAAEYLVVEEGESPSPEAGTDAWMVEVGVNLPIWLGKLRAGVREAREMQAESRAAYAAERNRVRTEVATAASRARSLRQVVDLYDRQLIPQAELALDATRSSYRSGGIGFLDLLETERALVRARVAAARARADLARSVADWARATAAPLSVTSGVSP